MTILDVVNNRREKIAEEEIHIKFGKNNIGAPLVIHLAEDEERMTLVMNPFLGVTGIYDRYVDISPDDGLGRDATL